MRGGGKRQRRSKRPHLTLSPRSAGEGTPAALAAPWLLSLPALVLFVAIVIVPLAMTVLLSFHDWGQYKGIQPVLILKNWREVLGDPYFREMFARTFRIAVLVTLIAALLGAPEAYILNRMRAPWRGLFLLVILGPLLISVVARTLGWALLFGGSSGVVNKALMGLGLISAPLPFMFTETGVVVALTHVLLPFMVLSVWAALQRIDPQIENAAASLGAGHAHHPAAHRAAAGHAGRAVGRHHRVRAGCQRIRHAGHHRRAPAEGGGDARLRRVPQHAQLAAGRGCRRCCCWSRWWRSSLGCNRLVERRYAEAFR